MNPVGRAWAGLDRWLEGLQAPAPPPPRLGLVDAGLALAAAVAAFIVAFWGEGVLANDLYTHGSFNLWFQADNPRVLANLLDPASNQYRATVHPILAILFTPWMSLIPRMGAAPLDVAKDAVLACAAASGALMYVILRSLDLPRLAAAAFTALFIASAGFLDWYSVVECAPFAGLSILPALLLLVRGPGRGLAWPIFASATSLSITVTNWSIGLAATVARFRLSKSVRISASAFVLVMALSVGQHLVYRSANFFFSPTGLLREKDYLAPEQHRWAPLENLRALVVYTVVAPPPVVEHLGEDRIITNQSQPMGAAGPVGVVAMGAWLVALALGAWGMLRDRRRYAIAGGLALMVTGQLVLGCLYGDISFLYATNILPELILVAAFAWFTPLRWIGLVLATVVVIAGGMQNARQFQAAAGFARQIVDTGGDNEDWHFRGSPVILPRRTPGATTP
jgi:hypothetical protein